MNKEQRKPLFLITMYITLFVGIYIVLLGILAYMRFGLDTKMSNEFFFKLPLYVDIGTTAVIFVVRLYMYWIVPFFKFIKKSLTGK